MLIANVTQLNSEISANEYVVVGRFGRSYGVHGWIKVLSFTDPLENIILYPKWYTKARDNWLPLDISECKSHGQYLLAKISGIDSPETVKRYTNFDIAIPRDNLPSLTADEVYLCDLPGCTVVNLAGDTLGTLTDIFDSGAHDILNIKGKQNYLTKIGNIR